ncbi:hypothetical protein [Yoonia sp. SDW83-1]
MSVTVKKNTPMPDDIRASEGFENLRDLGRILTRVCVILLQSYDGF